MFEAYCDETESLAYGKPLLVLAGYIADADVWRAFSQRWQERILNRYEIPFFHSKELRSGNAKHYRHLTRQKRRSLVLDAAAILHESGLNAHVAILMHPSDWDDITSPEERARFGSAYRVAVEYMLVGLCNTIGSTKIGEEPPVSRFMEDGHRNAMDGLKHIRGWKNRHTPIEMPLCLSGVPLAHIVQVPEGAPRTQPIRIREWPAKQIRIESYGLVNKRSVIPVQAADLLAYLIGASNRDPNHPDEIFEGVQPLLGGIHCVLTPLDAAELIRRMREWYQRRKAFKAQRQQYRNALRSIGIDAIELPTGQFYLTIQETEPELVRRLKRELAELKRKNRHNRFDSERAIISND